jgi:hypothetical protein
MYYKCTDSSSCFLFAKGYSVEIPMQDRRMVELAILGACSELRLSALPEKLSACLQNKGQPLKENLLDFWYQIGRYIPPNHQDLPSDKRPEPITAEGMVQLHQLIQDLRSIVFTGEELGLFKHGSPLSFAGGQKTFFKELHDLLADLQTLLA